MKLSDAVIVTKGACFVVIGGMTPLASGLGQWIDAGTWPPTINWVVILAGCAVGGATQLLSFLSSSYSDYVQIKAIGARGPSPTAVAAAKPIGP